MSSAEDPQVLGNCLYAIAAVLLSLKIGDPKAVGLQVEGYAKLTSKQTVYKLSTSSR